MKLVSCKVLSFGTLKNFEYDFNEGLNTIKEDNGWGKSTFATFIKVMFYGINDGKRSVAENERIKYRPWNQTERFGGSLVFEWAGKRYRIERFFGNKASEDAVHLFDEQTGREFSRTEDLGKRVFGVDEEGFLSTAYFSQKDFEIKSNTSITAKYNEVCEIQDSELFDKAVEKLENRAKEFKSRGDKGLIPEIKHEIFLVGDRIEQANHAQENADRLKSEAEALEREVAELKARDAALRERAAKAGRAEAVSLKKERYRKLSEERERYTLEIENADKILRGKNILKDTVASLKECIDGLQEVKSKKVTAAEDVARLESASANKAVPEKRKELTPLRIFLFAITAVLLCVGIAGLVFDYNVVAAIAFAFALAAGTAVAIISVRTGKKKTSAENSAVAAMLEEKRGALRRYTEDEEKYTVNLGAFFGQFGLVGDNYREFFERVREASERRESARRAVSELTVEIDLLEKDSDIFAASESTDDIKSINAELSTVGEWYRSKAELLARKKAAVREYEKEADEIPELENRRRSLAEKAEEYAKEYEIINLTLTYLKKADENLKIKYRRPLTESLNKYLSYITDGNIRADIDIDLKVTVNEEGVSRETDFFSKGYRNLFDICKRFALADVIFTGEKPFMILDDPFGNLDDKKLSSSLGLLKKLQNDYQILYLVCHESRRAL